MLEAVLKVGKEEPDVNCCYFTDPYDAMGAKTDANVIQNGLYILQEKFARGFDLKFAMNAHVVIYADKCLFSASTVRQMVGRANRAQGIAHGRVFILAANTMLAETTMNYIEQKDKQKSNDVGNSVIKFLIAKFIGMDSQSRTALFSLFCGQKWRLAMSDYHKLHETVKTVLAGYLD